MSGDPPAAASRQQGRPLGYSSSFSDKDRDDDGSTFFDSLSRQWVRVDNFAFSSGGNYFDGEVGKKENFLSAKKDATDSCSTATTLSLLPQGDVEAEFSVVAEENGDDDDEFERLFRSSCGIGGGEVKPREVEEASTTPHQPPKIVTSPRDEDGGANASRTLRRLSGALGGATPGLPSRSSPGVTPKEEETVAEHNVQPPPPEPCRARSSIPRYVKRRQQSRASPVQRRIGSSGDAPQSSSFGDQMRRSFTQQRSRSAVDMEPEEEDEGEDDRGRGHQLSPRSRLHSKSEGNLAAGLRVSSHPRPDFSHVRSKVGEYIREIKEMQQQHRSSRHLSAPGARCKSKSMSNLAMQDGQGKDSTPRQESLGRRGSFEGRGDRGRSTNLNRMKAFISSSHLDRMRVTVTAEGDQGNGGGGVKYSSSLASIDRLDKSRISRLLDHLSDEDDHRQDGAASADLTLDVEDILALAMEERREKKEAEKVLSQLQENYDRLQRKYAEAENRLDKYRFGRGNEDCGDGGVARSGGRGYLDPSASGPDSAFYTESSLLVVPHTARETSSTSRVSPHLMHLNFPQTARSAGDATAAAAAAAGSNNSTFCNTDRLLCDSKLQQQHQRRKDKDLSSSDAVEEARRGLRELEGQLFGVDLAAATGLTAAERAASAERLRREFATILQNLPDETTDKDLMLLLDKVGSKLGGDSFKDCDVGGAAAAVSTSDAAAAAAASVAEHNGAAAALDLSIAAVDPIEKVERWKIEEHHRVVKKSGGGGDRRGAGAANAAASSCYGSLPTSPSPPAVEEEEEEEEDLDGAEEEDGEKTPTRDAALVQATASLAVGNGDKQTPSAPAEPAEFDSGYPGSDRSVRYYSLKGISPAGNQTGQRDGKGGGGSRRRLFNLEEEDKSQHQISSAREHHQPSTSAAATTASDATATASKSNPRQPSIQVCRETDDDDGASSSSLPSDYHQGEQQQQQQQFPPPPPPRRSSKLAKSRRSPSPAARRRQQRRSTAATSSASASALLRPPNVHRTYLHSVTDLSSDERSMFEEQQRQQQQQMQQHRHQLLVKGADFGEASEEIATARTETLTTASTPSLPNPASYIRRGSAPVSLNQQQQHLASSATSPPVSANSNYNSALARQIDREILELRNFFDDHREEMMAMLKEGGGDSQQQQLQQHPSITKTGPQPPKQQQQQPSTEPALAGIRPRSRQLQQISQNLQQQPQFAVGGRMSSADSGTDLCELERERRAEFEKRRRARRRGNGQQQQQQHQQQASDFILGPQQQQQLYHQQQQQLQNGISSFFPKMSSAATSNNRIPAATAAAGAPSSHSYSYVSHAATTATENNSCAELSAGGDGGDSGRRFGSVFVPRLDLDDVWTTEDDRDPRSFDFNLQPHSQQEEEEGVPKASKNVAPPFPPPPHWQHPVVEERLVGTVATERMIYPGYRQVLDFPAFRQQRHFQQHQQEQQVFQQAAPAPHQLPRSRSVGELLLATPGEQPPSTMPPPSHLQTQPSPYLRHGRESPLVVVQTSCCRHADCAGTNANTSARASSSPPLPPTAGRRRDKASSPPPSPTAHAQPHPPRPQSRSSSSLAASLGFARSGSVRARKKRSKAKRELRNLLSSLEQANKLAASLRERSRDIVEALGDEIKWAEEGLGEKK